MTTPASTATITDMGKAEVDYTAVVEPSRSGWGRSVEKEGPLQSNMRSFCMTRPGTEVRIATYRSQSVASTVANRLRRGKKPVPVGTTAAQWQFKSGRLDDGSYGLWATYLGDVEGVA